MVDGVARASLLYDFYGALLPERQREVMSLYHEENFSLAEIAEEFGISRQAVHDALHKAEQSLNDYEDKLALVEKFLKTEKAVENIKKEIDNLKEMTGDKALLKGLDKIIKMTKEL